MEFLLFVIAILIGALGSWLIFNWKSKLFGKKKSINLKVESNVLLERIEKVFKVVLAEGYFTEIYDHNSRRDFWGLFEANKKALVVAKAKVSIGYDFAKLVMERDEKNKKLVIESFPKPEVISIDTDYKFYDINQGWLHKFNTEDYTKILKDAKSLMREKALESDLPAHASRQIELMINQLAAGMGWEVENKAQLPARKSWEEEKKGKLLSGGE